MTGKVTHIGSKKRDGESYFLTCNCIPEGEPPLVQIIETPEGPVITNLVCPNCERETPVSYGRV